MNYEWLEAHQFPCFFREIWGVECPGCGFQTAILSLLKGDIQAALMTWPGILPLFGFGVLIVVRCCGVKKISSNLLKGIGFLCLAVIFFSYILRLIKSS